MRILFLTQTYPRFDGDTAGPFIRDLARGLVRSGDEVTVLAPHCRGMRERWFDKGVETRTFRYAPERYELLGYSRSLSSDETVRWRAGLVAPFYAFAAGRKLKALLARRRFDLAHAHWIVPNGLAAAVALPHIPLAIGLHGSDVFLAEKRWVRPLVTLTLRRTELLTGCSPELVERICALGFDDQRATVIPYGVDTEEFSPDTDRRELWRQKLAIPAGAGLVLAVGRMVVKKGFQILLRVLPALLEEFPQAHFVLAGEGDLLEEFRRTGEGHGKRVHFPGVILRDTLPDLYRAADIFVLPAVHDAQGNVDGLPNVILEAMASGLPVVASGISGIPLAVGDGLEGLLVKEGDAEQLRQSLSRLLRDPGMRRAMGGAARRKAEADLTWNAVAARYRTAYQETLIRVRGSAAGEGQEAV